MNARGSQVLKELEQTAKSIGTSTQQDKALVKAINNVDWVQSTNSLVISGPPETIDRIRSMIEKYDVPRAQASSFYVYKPKGMSADEFRQRVITTSKELQSLNLDDPSLIETLASAKVVNEGSAVMFTGTPENISKVKDMVPAYFFGTSKSIRHIVKRKNIPVSQYLYATYNKRYGLWTTYTAKTKPNNASPGGLKQPLPMKWVVCF